MYSSLVDVFLEAQEAAACLEVGLMSMAALPVALGVTWIGRQVKYQADSISSDQTVRKRSLKVLGVALHTLGLLAAGLASLTMAVAGGYGLRVFGSIAFGVPGELIGVVTGVTSGVVALYTVIKNK